MPEKIAQKNRTHESVPLQVDGFFYLTSTRRPPMGKIAFFLRGVHIGVLRVPPRPQRFFMEFQVLPNIRIVEGYPAIYSPTWNFLRVYPPP